MIQPSQKAPLSERQKIFWLASYPKSGNTWIRVILTNYFQNKNEPANINRLMGGPIASSRLWFDEWSGLEASVLDDDTIAQLRPEVYRCMAREMREPFFLKAHDCWNRAANGEPLFPADVTAGVIYILRNPLDVAVSYSHHSNKPIDQMVRELCNPDFTMVRSEESCYNQLSQKLRCWSGHVQSWVDDSGLPLHIVRYEDLKENTEKTFRSLLEFSGIEVDGERLRRAVHFSSLKELQKQESNSGFREKAPKTASPFFRQGASNAWNKEMPLELAQKIVETHGETMKRFGYSL